MRILLVLGWLMLPVLVGVYHLGPGQEQLVLDNAGRAIREARGYQRAEQWGEAVVSFDRALELLPGDRSDDVNRVRIEKAKAQMMAHQLPAAHQDLKVVVGELQADESADPALLTEARAALANSQYYMTWLMRLEGVPRPIWEPEIESARQINRLLAETSESVGDQQATVRHQEDLESAIRLARMDLSELQGLPLPSQ